MKDKLLDREICDALHGRTGRIEVSNEAKSRVMVEINKMQVETKMQIETKIKENRKMKKFSVKLGTAVCALVCLSCMTAMAATGIINGWVGHNLIGTETGDFAEITEELVPKLEFQPTLLEEFSNGFTFEQAHLGETTALDENNERFGKEYTDLWLSYVNAETGEEIALTYNNIPDEAVEPLPGAPEVITRVVNDVVLSYQAMPYKFVPPNYELTDEDKAALESGAIEISVGTATVEEKTACNVTWTVDGIDHHMLGWNLELGADGMLDMAEELVLATVAE